MSDKFQSLPWGYGGQLLECRVCGALILGDEGSAKFHDDWHFSTGTDEAIMGREIRKEDSQ